MTGVKVGRRPRGPNLPGDSGALLPGADPHSHLRTFSNPISQAGKKRPKEAKLFVGEGGRARGPLAAQVASPHGTVKY